MAFLHSREPPVVHRDLKSHNVLSAPSAPSTLRTLRTLRTSARCPCLCSADTVHVRLGVHPPPYCLLTAPLLPPYCPLTTPLGAPRNGRSLQAV